MLITWSLVQDVKEKIDKLKEGRGLEYGTFFKITMQNILRKLYDVPTYSMDRTKID